MRRASQQSLPAKKNSQKVIPEKGEPASPPQNPTQVAVPKKTTADGTSQHSMIGHMVFGDMKKIIDDKMEKSSEAIFQQAKVIHRLVRIHNIFNLPMSAPDHSFCVTTLYRASTSFSFHFSRSL